MLVYQGNNEIDWTDISFKSEPGRADDSRQGSHSIRKRPPA
jgi:hypothetical protein